MADTRESTITCDEKVVEEKWTIVLAHIWRQVKWSRIHRNRLDVFEHRLEYAKYEPDVASVMQRLGNALGIQGVNVPLEDLEYLRACNELAMDVLRRWTKLLALKAMVFSTKHLKKKEQGGENK